MSTKVPVADGIFTWPSDAPKLLGSRCTNCGNHMFPVQDGCPRCMSSESEQVELATRGTLWSWTVQGFPPKSPPYLGPTGDDFRPYGVGYIELPDQVRVEARLTEARPERLRIGMEMDLVIDSLGVDEEGNELITYAFAPVQEDKS
jgi:uncharacterized OB-fold protein